MNQPERNPAGTVLLGSSSCLKYHPPAVIYASESSSEGCQISPASAACCLQGGLAAETGRW